MPANPFLAMNRHLQRAFAHSEPIVWLRPGGPPNGHPLVGWYSAVSEMVDADGFAVTVAKSRITLFVDDIFAIDPSRSSRDPEEILREDDRLSVGGKTFRVESCKADGFNKVDVQLSEV